MSNGPGIIMQSGQDQCSLVQPRYNVARFASVVDERVQRLNDDEGGSHVRPRRWQSDQSQGEQLNGGHVHEVNAICLVSRQVDAIARNAVEGCDGNVEDSSLATSLVSGELSRTKCHYKFEIRMKTCLH